MNKSVSDWQLRDEQYVWHPFTQMKLSPHSLPIIKGKGSYLYDESGKKYIDAIASWWVNCHGHAHPYIARKVNEQFKELEHVLFAGFTHPPAILLAEKLLQITEASCTKVFYSDNGSTAVEVALKMAFQYWHNKGENKTEIIAFHNSYHGDTFGAMSVSERTFYNQPFSSNLFSVLQIQTPDANNIAAVKEKLLALIKRKTIAAFIFEPLIQGAEGMRIYEAQYLDELIALCKKHEVICIADEVMTGFYRTGKFFAAHHLKNKPHIMCLSKGLTGGTMALGATLCQSFIYDAFYSNDRFKTFFHGHSYTANPLACAAALASLDLFQRPKFKSQLQMICAEQEKFVAQLQATNQVKNPRNLGTIVAFELSDHNPDSYFHLDRDIIYRFYMDNGIVIRPLGNTVYILPPYTISKKDLNYVYQKTFELIQSKKELSAQKNKD